MQESRNPTGIDQGLSPWERSGNIRRVQTSWSGSYRFSDLSGRSLQSTRMIWDFSHPLSWLCKRLQRLTWSACLKTPTSVRSTPREWQLCQRTCNLRAEFGESVHEFHHNWVDIWCLRACTNFVNVTCYFFFTCYDSQEESYNKAKCEAWIGFYQPIMPAHVWGNKRF